jgi:hypothetical protein
VDDNTFSQDEFRPHGTDDVSEGRLFGLGLIGIGASVEFLELGRPENFESANVCHGDDLGYAMPASGAGCSSTQ